MAQDWFNPGEMNWIGSHSKKATVYILLCGFYAKKGILKEKI